MIDYASMIKESGKTIYDYDSELLIPTYELELILNSGLVGTDLSGLPNRTRSKVVNEKICKVLGYPVPARFQKTQPRFLAQNFDKYVQKSNNLQIWNEEIAGNRRYVIIQINNLDSVSKVKVITGEQLSPLDTTGTLTSKYQARMKELPSSCLLAQTDTSSVAAWCSNDYTDIGKIKLNADPIKGKLMSISSIFEKLKDLEGATFADLGAVQDRNRGAGLHLMISEILGYGSCDDDGSYPDIRNQLLEIKLQTSPTIDLGLHSPEDKEVIFQSGDDIFISADVRYAIVSANIVDEQIVMEKVFVVNGENFTKYFPLFGGKVTNSKLQIPLPANFFN
jgi:hypothetical protein